MNEDKKEVEKVAATGIALFQERVLALCDGDMSKSLALQKYADMQGDYDYILSLNTEMSNKYQEIMDCFPMADEITFLISEIQSQRYERDYTDVQIIKRVENLNKFKSALICLENQDDKKVIHRYDVDKGKVVEWKQYLRFCFFLLCF